MVAPRERPVPAAVQWLLGPVLLVAGGFGVAVACGLVRLDPASFHAPPWLAGAIGVAFAAMGLILLLDGCAALQRLRGWLAFVFLACFATVFNWVAFGPGERHFTTRTSAGASVVTSAESSELGGRIAFGVFAVLLDLLIASPLIVWLWRRARRSVRPPEA